MEEQYAIVSKKVALVCGLVCFLVFMAMIYPVFENQKEPEQVFFCGVKSSPNKKEFMEGKMLYINNCASCHNKNMKDSLTGPPLRGMHNYMKDEKQLLVYLNEKEKYFKIYKNLSYKKSRKKDVAQCTDFPNLKQDDVNNLMIYIQGQGGY
jgi:cytochrome c2